jgi:hypothetical protein
MVGVKFAAIEESTIPVAMVEITIEMMIVVSKELAIVENNHRRKWDKVKPPEEPDRLPPPPRHWLDPTRTRVVEIVRVGTDRCRRRLGLKSSWLLFGLRLLRGISLGPVRVFGSLVRIGELGALF